MASIKLKGDTSGEITIQAPSVAGTNTLNLQASSGTLATTTQVDNVYNSLGVRNLIINGDMRIAQRGTSATGITGDGYYTSDRFYVVNRNVGTWTQTQDTDVPTGQGFSNSLKMSCTTAAASLSATDQLRLEQRIEAQNLQHLKFGTANAESLTLSFWVKSNKTGTYTVWLYAHDDVRSISKTYTINTADTWEKKTITIEGDTVAVIDNDTDFGLFCTFSLGAGSNFTSGTLNTSWNAHVSANMISSSQVNLADSTSNYINFTGVQLEVGDTATPFEHRPYDMELQRCQRYYYKRADVNTKHIGIADYFNSSIARCGIDLPVTMRTIPSLDIVSGTNYYRISGNGTSDYMNSLSMAPESTENFAVIQNSSEVSGTAGTCGFLLTANASAFIGFSAEL
jgi:hypothetical protein